MSASHVENQKEWKVFNKDFASRKENKQNARAIAVLSFFLSVSLTWSSN